MPPHKHIHRLSLTHVPNACTRIARVMRIWRRSKNRILFDILLVLIGYVIGSTIMDFTTTTTGTTNGGWSFSVFSSSFLSSHHRHPCSRAENETKEAEEEGEERATRVGMNATEKRADDKVFDATLMVGVMTTRRNLESRAAAIYATWGGEASVLVVFYIGKETNSSSASASSFPSSNTSSSDTSTAATSRSSARARPRDFSKKTAAEGEEKVGAEPIKLVKGLPVVRLEGVDDDTYPPRDKCFAMLRHMHVKFGTRIRWFLRADDDVYIRLEQLVRFLNSLDDTKRWYMGKPGTGAPKERGLLGLRRGQLYCMGGPGVIFSSVSLALLVPHLPECAQSSVTSHEDTELGRCVIRHLSIACTNSRMVDRLFLQDYYKHLTSGRPLLQIDPAVTMHPIKDPQIMHKLHINLQVSKQQELITRQKDLLLEINKAAVQIKSASLRKTSTTNGGPPFRNTSGPSSGNTSQVDVRPVSEFSSSGRPRQGVERFVESKLSHTANQGVPGTFRKTRQNPSWMEWLLGTWGEQVSYAGSGSSNTDKESLMLEVFQENNPYWPFAVLKKKTYAAGGTVHRRWVTLNRAMSKLSNFMRAMYEPSVLRDQRLVAQYQSYTPVQGPQHMATYSRRKGYQSFLLSSTWGELQWRELWEYPSPERLISDDLNHHHEKELSRPKIDDLKRQEDVFSLKNDARSKESVLRKGEDSGRNEDGVAKFHSGLSPAAEEKAPAASRKADGSKNGGGDDGVPNSWPDLTVLLPLSGRHETYVRFLKQLTAAASRYPAHMFLRVALYPDPLNETMLNWNASLRFSTTRLNVTVLFNDRQNFSRARAINSIAAGLNNSTVLFITDVDLIITPEYLYRAALNTQPGTAYFPIFFSRYSQDVYCYGRKDNCTMDPTDFSRDAGMWRHFSFGMQVITAGDFNKSEGYDSEIVGWGKEDRDFYSRCIARGINVFRAPDVGLVHPYHTKACDPQLKKDQLTMCYGSRNATYGSAEKLSEMINDIKEFQ